MRRQKRSNNTKKSNKNHDEKEKSKNTNQKKKNSFDIKKDLVKKILEKKINVEIDH